VAKLSSTSEDDEVGKGRNDQEQTTALQSNFERLTSHLAKGSLAAELVLAYAEPGDAAPADAVAKAITDRLDELKRSYGRPEDQQS
jgi:hypothetical protein